MSINFSTYSQELNEFKNKLMGSQDPTDWVLFGYGNGNDLKLIGSGGKQLVTEYHLKYNLFNILLDGGLDELKDEFEGCKVQYALVRVIEPDSKLPKIIFISWVKFYLIFMSCSAQMEYL